MQQVCDLKRHVHDVSFLFLFFLSSSAIFVYNSQSTLNLRGFVEGIMFLVLAIAFIKCLNRNHMRNNIKYKGNINNNIVIFF